MAERFHALPIDERKKIFDEAALDNEKAEALLHRWDFWARPNQLEPPGDWTNWLVMAGRGFGKTRVGSEQVRKWIKDYPIVNLVGPTFADVRDVMVKGSGAESSIMEVCTREERPEYETSKRRLSWPNGAVSLLFSAEDPESLRGPQCMKMWWDEPAASKYPDRTKEQIDFNLRLGKNPQLILTTTPKPIKLIKELVREPGTIVTRGSTYDNKSNLALKFFETIIRKYEGTRLGRQEIDAELLEDRPGALWTLAMIDVDRVQVCPLLTRIVIAVDPAVTSGEDSAEWGIVAAGQGPSPKGVDWPPHYYIFDDLSEKLTPNDACTKIVGGYQVHKADRIVAEVNNGGDLVEALLRTKGAEFAYSPVHASRGKLSRAEPISALYEQHRVHHVGAFPILEDQMTDYVPFASKSPDRMDALVWAVSALSGENEQEVIYEESHLQSIAPDLDEADFRQF